MPYFEKCGKKSNFKFQKICGTFFDQELSRELSSSGGRELRRELRRELITIASLRWAG